MRPERRRGAGGGDGNIEVESFIELHDPAHLIKFAIVNEFTRDRILTCADFDIESLRVAPGRHVGIHTPADNELILVKLATPLN